MKKAIIILSSLSTMAMAANYTWVGPENGQWNVSSNWDINNGYYPQSDSDHAFIGDNKSVIWSGGYYYGASDSITLGQNSVLSLTAGGDIAVNTFTIGRNSAVNWTSDYHLGYLRSFTINYGTFTVDSYGQFNVTTGQKLWYNNKKVTLNGVLDFAEVDPGEGTIRLYTLNGSVDGLNIDYSGLQVINTNDRITYEIKQENNGVSIAYKVAPVPEPATATLSLMALAGLAARRRRR